MVEIEAGKRAREESVRKLRCRETLFRGLGYIVFGLVLLAIGGTISHVIYSAGKWWTWYFFPVGFFIAGFCLFGALFLLLGLAVLIGRKLP